MIKDDKDDKDNKMDKNNKNNKTVDNNINKKSLGVTCVGHMMNN